MEFFCWLKNKFKDSYVSIIVSTILVILSDVLIIYYFKNNKSITNSTISYVKKEEETFNNKNTIKVDIKGYIKNPGVYEVNEDNNVFDLINIAGGLKKGATTDNINLSKKLKDEMVVIISKKNEIRKNSNNNIISEVNEASTTLSEVVGTNEEVIKDDDNDINKLININIATVDELLSLPNIGESKVKAILEYREKTLFNSIDEIKNISGIGDSIFEKIKDKITV